MKKKENKKLRLSRETLQTLTSSDNQKVVGGSGESLACAGTSPLTGCALTDDGCG